MKGKEQENAKKGRCKLKSKKTRKKKIQDKKQENMKKMI